MSNLLFILLCLGVIWLSFRAYRRQQQQLLRDRIRGRLLAAGFEIGNESEEAFTIRPNGGGETVTWFLQSVYADGRQAGKHVDSVIDHYIAVLHEASRTGTPSVVNRK